MSVVDDRAGDFAGFHGSEGVVDVLEVEGLTASERRLLAHGIVGLAEGTSRHWIHEGLPGAPAELAARVAELAWAGLRGINRD